MRIVAVKCLDCQAEFEILESFPKDLLSCPACQSKKLEFEITDKEFSGCAGSCDSCDSCE